jgi:hypothetical protein
VRTLRTTRINAHASKASTSKRAGDAAEHRGRSVGDRPSTTAGAARPANAATPTIHALGSVGSRSRRNTRKRRHAPQREHGRRTEGDQHDEADRITLQGRQPCRPGNRDRERAREPFADRPLQREAIATPTVHRDQPEPRQFAEVHGHQRALLRAEARMTALPSRWRALCDAPPSRPRSTRGTTGDQRRQPRNARRDRAPSAFRARVFDRFDALAAAQCVRAVSRKRAPPARRPRRRGDSDAAAFLHEAGLRHVVEIDRDARRVLK